MSNQELWWCHECDARKQKDHSHTKKKNFNGPVILPTAKDKAKNRRFLKGWS